jgi:hypothetical protein
MADHDRLADEGLEFRRDRAEARGIADVLVLDAVNGAGHGRDRHPRIDQLLEPLGLIDADAAQPDRADLHQPRRAGIEPRRFRVHDHTVERQERGRRHIAVFGAELRQDHRLAVSVSPSMLGAR